MSAIRLTVWNEFRHEKKDDAVRKVYPEGIHAALAEGLRPCGFEIRTATLDEPEHGLTDDVLASTDVLTWWGHMSHGDVSDDVVSKVCARVLEGMGLIVLHSAHYSRPFNRLMGTSCSLKWREAGEKERLWVVEPSHPIVKGIDEYVELEHTEMYGEFFDIPEPDELVFVSWFPGGEVFRSGCSFRRGQGRVFYFRPGHETFPIYRDENILKVLANAVRWAAPVERPKVSFGNRKPLERLD